MSTPERTSEASVFAYMSRNNTLHVKDHNINAVWVPLALPDDNSGLRWLKASPRVTDASCLFYRCLTHIVTCLFPWKQCFFSFVRPRTELQSPLAKTSKQWTMPKFFKPEHKLERDELAGAERRQDSAPAPAGPGAEYFT